MLIPCPVTKTAHTQDAVLNMFYELHVSYALGLRGVRSLLATPWTQSQCNLKPPVRVHAYEQCSMWLNSGTQEQISYSASAIHLAAHQEISQVTLQSLISSERHDRLLLPAHSSVKHFVHTGEQVNEC